MSPENDALTEAADALTADFPHLRAAVLAAIAERDSLLIRVERAEATLRGTVELLRPAGNIAFNMKQLATYTSDRDNYARIHEAIDTVLDAARAALPATEAK